MDILLAVPPFTDLRRPPLGVSLLQAGIRRRGLTSTIRYDNLRLASLIGLRAYDAVVGSFGMALLAGDWMFSKALFREAAPDPEGYLRHVMAAQAVFDDECANEKGVRGKSFSSHLERIVWPEILRAREQCAAFADRTAEEILARRPPVVGFTVSSQQLCAALAVARRLKEGDRTLRVVLGGPACFGEKGLGLLRAFPWLDYVCTGEGDRVFPGFVERLLRKGDPSPLPGILAQGCRRLSLPPLTRRLDRLPTPDFGDFFREAASARIGDKAILPYETTRGCWWGEKSRCGFCGNPEEMQLFRSKSPRRIRQELPSLCRAWGPSAVGLCDDVLAPSHYRTLYPDLATDGVGVPFYCQTRTNLTRTDLHSLKEAGAASVWFGIESLSNRQLGLLRKGNRVEQAIQALRWSQEVGIRPVWNILYGIPGEAAEDYEAMRALLPLLEHLHPPEGCFPLVLMRFSPYRQNASVLGLDNLRPAEAYRHIFPLPAAAIEGFAVYYECDFPGSDPGENSLMLRRDVRGWRSLWKKGERPRLDMYRAGGGSLLVLDTRRCAVRPSHRLEGLDAEVLLRCDRARDIRGVTGCVEASTEGGIEESLRRLVDAGLVWSVDGNYVSLPLFRNRGRSAQGSGT